MRSSVSTATITAAVAALLFLSLFSSVTAARPCKTIFISYTFASNPSSGFALREIHASTIPTSSSSYQNPTRFLALYRVFKPQYYNYYRENNHYHHNGFEDKKPGILAGNYLDFHARHARAVAADPVLASWSSLQERARDILVVVVGLLVGVGCGALTAATMYLAWSLITNRYDICGAGSEGDYDEEEEFKSPKKMGYVTIPTAEFFPAKKEGLEGN